MSPILLRLWHAAKWSFPRMAASWSITGKLNGNITRRRTCDGYTHPENKNVAINAVQFIHMLNDNGGVEPCGNGVFFPE
jgi:hypothetical protein